MPHQPGLRQPPKKGHGGDLIAFVPPLSFLPPDMAMRDNEAKRQKRLVEYVCLVGVDQLVLDEDEEADEDCFERTQHPQLLRRFPAQDHPDCNIFFLPFLFF